MTASNGTADIRPTKGMLHVVVTCTERKTRRVDPALRAANLPSVSLTGRVEAWTNALKSASSAAEPADTLYAGDHWQAARSIARTGSNSAAVCVWVVSAGYGLVQLDTPLHPYAATFARRHADSVVPRQAEFSGADWWRELACWRPKDFTGPRTLEELGTIIAAEDVSFLLISLSRTYAAALSDDIQAAARRLPDRVGVVSIGSNSESGSTRTAALAAQMIPGNARLKAVVGGAMQSLNVRIAGRIVREASEWFPSFSHLAHLTSSWLEAAPPSVVYDRAKLGDDAVREFILNALQADPTATHTALLRRLRDNGQACEQSRFRALFQEMIRIGRAGRQSLLGLDHPVAAHDSALPAPSL